MKHSTLVNFRDLGGVRTSEGELVRTGLIYRGASLYRLPESGVEELRRLRVGLVIDLRTERECVEKPDMLIDGVEYVRCPILSDSRVGITRETGSDPVEALRRLRHADNLEEMVPDMEALYRAMLSDEKSLEELSCALKAVIRSVAAGVPVLFHCTVGKDRTGVLALVLYMLLGVSEQDIVRDYFLSNRNVRYDALKKAVAALLITWNTSLAKAMYRLLTAREEYIGSALEYIHSSGSICAFARDALSLSQEQILVLRKSMLES